jgi:hypothetical protein
LDKVKPDRRELDKIIMGEILGLTEQEQLEVYRSIIDLVKSRLEKAKSTKGKKHTEDGLNIDLFIQTVIYDIGEENLLKFYQTRVKNYNPTVIRSLPDGSGEVKINHELFGWRLSRDNQYVDCNSELEARYLKVWMEMGLTTIVAPENEEGLKKLVPDLEALTQKINAIFESHLNSIVAAKLKDQLRQLLLSEVIKGVQNATG